MQFRTDIQILRAIAVLAVVAFHLQITGFASGFLGVDVFFVVSGFLMQKLYARNPSPAAFYQRRAARLLPVYFACLFLSIFAAFFITLPADFAQVGEQGLYAASFTSNIGFWFGNSYWNKDNFTPFLHLWSLGVEVQYYLFVPLIFWLCRKHRAMLWLLTFASLALCLALITFSPKTGFFMMPARFWEFGLGMLAARHALSVPKGRIGLAAMAGIIAAMFLPVTPEALSPLIGHPGGAALLITVLTAAALMFGVPDGWFANPVGRAMAAIGNASYTLYLVHFPVILLWFYGPFWGTRFGSGTLQDIWAPVLIMAALTPALYWGIEKRRADWVTLKSTATLCVALALTSWLAPIAQIERFSPAERTIFKGVTDRGPVRCGQAHRFTDLGAEACTVLPLEGQPIENPRGTVLFLGDSHSDVTKLSFAEAAKSHGFSVIIPTTNDALRRDYLGADWLVKLIETQGINHVVLLYAKENLSLDVLSEAQAAASQSGVTLSLIAPTAQEVPTVKLMNRMFEAARDGTPPPTLPRVILQESHTEVASFLAKHADTITLHDVNDALCDPATCRTVNDAGKPLYFDNGHLSLTGARLLQPGFERIFGEISDAKTASKTQQ